MKKHIMIASLAALVAMGLAIQADAGCGACGTHAEVKKACPPGCDKPCCAKADAAKKACGADCKKPCCDASKKKCSRGKCSTKAACAGKDASKCSAKSACSVKGDAKCPVKPAKACGPDCKKPCCAKGEIAEINTSGLKALLDSGAKVYVLDARSGKYDDGRRIPGAKAVAADASEKQIKKAVRSKDALVVTYCAGLKCPASAMLAGRLKGLGYENVIEYRHGIRGWTDAGYEVKTAR
ncbi:MAG: rhodanese-like domain-containing protein [Kiritimatiellae bacterium]|nr:rhodanese-like domain-containing protein [Kiritimatiellia bacterium]